MTELDRALHASVLKREAWKEAEWREKRAKQEEEVQLGFGATEMSKEELKRIIDSDRRIYYRTEELNDKLYIHYKGWKKLQNLENWTSLRALYAECNAFDCIQGLQNCRNLRSLFLQENCIRKIEGLENCPELWNINLSNNFVERIEGISHLQKLNTLTIAKNKIGVHGLADIEELVGSQLSCLDVQDNLIWDPDVLPEVLMRMPGLRVLYLKGNPCTKKIPNYRKNTTVCCEDLRYLDDRPVFAEDRRAADAFNRGGLEEERAERRRIREENTAAHERNMRAFNEMIANARAQKRESDAMRKEDKFTDETDPVETQEKRMKRQVDRWKEENADELKDDARERAEKCLRQEREREAAAQQATDGGTTDVEAIDAEDAVDSGMEAPARGEGEASKREERPSDEEQKKVDKRKLVYEDIWDEEPTAQAPEASSVSTGPVPASSAAPAVFLPWASGEGVAGMDSMAPSASALAVRAAELRAAEAPPPAPPQQGSCSASARDEAGQRPVWYSKFAEKAQGQREVRKPPAPSPPATRVAEANPVPGSELDEMD